MPPADSLGPGLLVGRTLQPVPGGDPRAPRDWPLFDAAGSRQRELAAAAALLPHTLMQRAGAALAALARAVAPHATRVWIVCGPGNNGGDGLEAASLLRAAGLEVHVSRAEDQAPPADAAVSLQRARAAGVLFSAGPVAPANLKADDLCLDALFGLGQTRAPAGWAREAIRALNHTAAPVLAVDLPTGLDGDHGTTFGDGTAVHARWTLALLTLKPGLFTGQGRDHAGQVWLDTLGVDGEDDGCCADLLHAIDPLWPTRRHAQHKGSYGDAIVVGGAPGMTGAVWLAGRAALAAGAGRCFVVPLDSVVTLDPQHPELMQREPSWLQSSANALAAATIACGCGGGDRVRPLLPGLIARAGRLLLDADALNALASDPALRTLLRQRGLRGRPTVLTPHPLEAGRLLGCSAAEVQADRRRAAQRLADDCQAVIVLKGSGSIVAAPGALPSINASGNAALATAGSGDVLAGWLAGLWSQGLGVRDAVRLAVASHGVAADRWAAGRTHPGPLEASALIDALRMLRNA